MWELIVPLCSDTIPHGFLGKYQRLPTKGLLAPVVAGQLFNVLLSNLLTSQRMTDALVDRMATSGSFAISRRTMTLLEKLPRLNDSQVAKLVQSTESNSQVREVDGIPFRIQRLVERIGKGIAPQ